MEIEIAKTLQQEREKLDRLVDAALADGTPIEETYAIMHQCRKIDRLADVKKLGAVLRDEAVQEQGRKVEELIARREGNKIDSIT